MGHALHADRPNEVNHFDFLYMGPSDTGQKHALILKDEASSFLSLEAYESADAPAAVESLMRRFAAFGVVKTWVSDRGPQFKNQLMDSLNSALHFRHHFTTAYCPQGNGTVETVCKEVLWACRALLSEFRMREREWPTLLKLLQSILDHSVRPSLRQEAPFTSFAGLPPDAPLLTLLPSAEALPQSIEFIRAQRMTRLKALIKAFDHIHKHVGGHPTRKRREAINVHNAKTHIQPINCEVGDFVLVAQRVRNDGHKLRVKWSGPSGLSEPSQTWYFKSRIFSRWLSQ